MQTESYLPSLTLYRRNCYNSQQSYLCFLSSTTEIKLIKFSKQNTIQNTLSIPIPLQPVKQISLQIIKENEEDKVYIGVAFVSRFIVFANKQAYFEATLKLDTNIVSYQNGYVGVDKYEHQGAKGFIFVAKNGQITIFNIANKNRILKNPLSQNKERVASLSVMYPYFYMGTQQGIVSCNLIEDSKQNYTVIATHDSDAKLPILNLAVSHKRKQIIATSCNGQIYLISQKFGISSLVSAHRCLISRVLIHGNNIYTAGEDFVLNKFQFVGDRQLKLVKSENFTQLISLLFSVNDKVYISFYETPKLKQV